MSTEKLSELSKPVFEIEVSGAYWLNCTSGKLTPDAGADFSDWPDGVNRLYSQEYVSALLARIEELEWRELNSTELKELLTWHPTEMSAATDPILWAAMRNKINLTRIRVASDEAKKDQSNG